MKRKRTTARNYRDLVRAKYPEAELIGVGGPSGFRYSIRLQEGKNAFGSWRSSKTAWHDVNLHIEHGSLALQYPGSY
jgi:hypothetical protein